LGARGFAHSTCSTTGVGYAVAVLALVGFGGW